jgi:pimeloyl-ACP methyl ester carboxylesterase
MGDSDHHNSFGLDVIKIYKNQEVSEDINRFIEEKKLTYVTVGGHGYGAKVASVFAGLNYDKVTGVICLDGGPIDHSFHEAWTDVKSAIIKCSQINMDVASQSDVFKVIDNSIKSVRWRRIFKDNVIDGKSSLQWRFNMTDLATNVKKNHRCDITRMSTTFGLFPGRAFVNFPDFSDWVFLNTNTIPFYTFFPKLEGQFPSTCFNYVQADEHTDSKYYNNIRPLGTRRRGARPNNHGKNG